MNQEIRELKAQLEVAQEKARKDQEAKLSDQLAEREAEKMKQLEVITKGEDVSGRELDEARRSYVKVTDDRRRLEAEVERLRLELEQYKAEQAKKKLAQLAQVTERVNHPKHYTQHPSGVECIDIVEHMTFCAGNAVKYLWRSGLKDGSPTLEDLKKAAWYAQREVERLEKAERAKLARDLQPVECREHHVQNCHACPDVGCGDNLSVEKR